MCLDGFIVRSIINLLVLYWSIKGIDMTILSDAQPRHIWHFCDGGG